MTHFDREPFDAACDHRQRREIHCVAIARDHLRADRLGHEAQLVRHIGFDLRVDIGEGADRARDGAGGDLFAGLFGYDPSGDDVPVDEPDSGVFSDELSN